MEWLSGLNLSPQLSAIGALVFVIALSVFAAYSRARGVQEGAPAPRVQEFYAGGALSDMGPVKELVEQTGLLVQQQVRTNLALERLCDLLGQLVVDLREDRERDELETERRRGYEDGLRDAEATQVRLRPPTSSARKTPRGG